MVKFRKIEYYSGGREITFNSSIKVKRNIKNRYSYHNS